MTTPNGVLNASREDYSSLAAALKFAQKSMLMDLNGCIPAQVEEYDHVRNVATVRPMIMITALNPKGGDHIRTPRPVLPDTPVMSFGAGGFHLHFPLKKGDLGWLYANDRDITLFLQNLAQAPAGSDGPSHSFRDGVFIPDVLRQYTLQDEDTGACVLQTTDGTTRISIRNNHIKVTAPDHVEINTPLTHMTGDCQIDGNLTVNMTALIKQMLTYMSGMTGHGGEGGGTTIEGPITQTGGDFTSDGISVQHHTHPHGEPNTGGPQ